jgi:hypothetical protein
MSRTRWSRWPAGRNLDGDVEGVAVADEQKDQATGPATGVADPEPAQGHQSEAQAPARAATSPRQLVQRTRSRTDAGARPRSAAAALAQVRSLVATVVFTAAVLAALVLALGAVLTALGANENNAVVSQLLALAGWLDGPLADVFTFDSTVKQVLVNWGIAAAVYLVVGRVAERLIRP